MILQRNKTYQAITDASFNAIVGDSGGSRDHLSRLVSALLIDQEEAIDYAESMRGKTYSIRFESVVGLGANYVDATLQVVSRFAEVNPASYVLDQLMEFSPKLAMWYLSWVVFESIQHATSVASISHEQAISAIFHVQRRTQVNDWTADPASLRTEKSFYSVLSDADDLYGRGFAEDVSTERVISVNAFRALLALCSCSEKIEARTAARCMAMCSLSSGEAMYYSGAYSTPIDQQVARRQLRAEDAGLRSEAGRYMIDRISRGASSKILDFSSGKSAASLRVASPTRQEVSALLRGDLLLDLLDAASSGIGNDIPAGIGMSLPTDGSSGISLMGSFDDMAVSKNVVFFSDGKRLLVIPLTKEVIGGRIMPL